MMMGATTVAPPPSSVASDLSNRDVPKVADVGPGCKLMHPEEDISLEEIRSRMPKYRVSKPSAAVHLSVSSGGGVMAAPQPSPMQNPPMPPIVRPGMGMPPMHGMIPSDVVRPGMGPPLMMGQPLPRSPFAPPMVAGQRPPMQGHLSPPFV